MTTKISSAQVSKLLTDSATALRKTASERDFYKDKCILMERRQMAEKLASTMHSKGMELDTSLDVLADRFEKVAANGKIEEWKLALDLAGPDMGQKLASVSDGHQVGGGSELERYIVGGVG